MFQEMLQVGSGGGITLVEESINKAWGSSATFEVTLSSADLIPLGFDSNIIGTYPDSWTNVKNGKFTDENYNGSGGTINKPFSFGYGKFKIDSAYSSIAHTVNGKVYCVNINDLPTP